MENKEQSGKWKTSVVYNIQVTAKMHMKTVVAPERIRD